MIVNIKPLEGIIRNPLSAPDAFEHHESSFTVPVSTHAISKDLEGNVLSCYADDSWDLSPYRSNPIQYSVIHFKKNIKKNIHIQEAKKIMFLYMVYGEGKQSSSYSVETLMSYFSRVIILLSKFSIKNNISISTMLSDNKRIKQYIDFYSTDYNKITFFSSFLTFIDRLDNGITGFDFTRDPEIFKYLLYLAKRHKNKTKQTEIIPTRILSGSISQRWQQINEIEKNINGITGYLEQHLELKNYSISWGRAKRTKKYKALFDDALINHNLHTLFSTYEVTEYNYFQKFLRKLQGTCRHLIHAYTGMRDGEVQSLKMDCLDKTDSNSLKLISKTSKFAGTQKKETWVTDNKIERIIKILYAINNVVSKYSGYKPEEIPLFIRLSLYTTNTKREGINAPSFTALDQLPLDEKSMKITETDIQELYDIDYMRDWRNEDKFKVGMQWHFVSHQYRRSIAVYSIQSGLVSLGALQKQFKHTFRNMSAYYGNGATFGKNHISQDINNITAEIQTLSYIKNIIFSDEKLFGTQGIIVEKNIKNLDRDKKTYILENRAITEKKFRDGLMAYKDTPLGGCVSTETCNSSLTRSFLPCVGCDSSILKESKLDHVISKQKNLVALLDKSSVEYRSETEDLKELKKLKNKLKGKRNE